ncbi:MAG: hypothetical protein IJD93_00845 [Ruminococcus sp.]|nr:hypothetical protein [Ruminococcus sp.]
MIKITCKNDLSLVIDACIKKHIENQLNYLLNTYIEECSEGSIESIGAIFYVENSSDFDGYTQFGLSSPINEERFEYIEQIAGDYYRGLIVLNNEKVIELIGKNDVFASLLKGDF